MGALADTLNESLEAAGTPAARDSGVEKRTGKVRPYTRRQGGKVVQVGGYDRKGLKAIISKLQQGQEAHLPDGQRVVLDSDGVVRVKSPERKDARVAGTNVDAASWAADLARDRSATSSKPKTLGGAKSYPSARAAEKGDKHPGSATTKKPKVKPGDRGKGETLRRVGGKRGTVYQVIDETGKVVRELSDKQVDEYIRTHPKIRQAGPRKHGISKATEEPILAPPVEDTRARLQFQVEQAQKAAAKAATPEIAAQHLERARRLEQQLEKYAAEGGLAKHAANLVQKELFSEGALIEVHDACDGQGCGGCEGGYVEHVHKAGCDHEISPSDRKRARETPSGATVRCKKCGKRLKLKSSGRSVKDEAKETVHKAGWSEALHPRDLDGQFIEVFGGGLTYSGITHAHLPKSEPFGGTHVADVQQVHSDGTADLSLHIESDHPAVQDALADGIIDTPDQFEAIARVPLKNVKANNDTVPLKKPALRALRAQEAKRVATEQARISEENRRRYLEGPRMSLPELDASNIAREDDLKLAKAEQFTKPGTANVSPEDMKKLAPLLRHYRGMAHPFTSCVKDQVKHGLSKDHADRRCAVIKDLIVGNTGWRKGGSRLKKALEDSVPDGTWTEEAGEALDRVADAWEIGPPQPTGVFGDLI